MGEGSFLWWPGSRIPIIYREIHIYREMCVYIYTDSQHQTSKHVRHLKLHQIYTGVPDFACPKASHNQHKSDCGAPKASQTYKIPLIYSQLICVSLHNSNNKTVPLGNGFWQIHYPKAGSLAQPYIVRFIYMYIYTYTYKYIYIYIYVEVPLTKNYVFIPF